jgi:hypothetical protein
MNMLGAPKYTVNRRDATDARTRAPALQLYVAVGFYFVVSLSKLRNSKKCQLS